MDTKKQNGLLNACAPFFLFLTTFRRNARTSKLDIAALKGALLRELDNVHRICSQDPQLAAQFERLRYALVAVADQVVLTSPWPHRSGWSMQPLESQVFGTLQGGSQFFRVVDEILDDPRPEAREMSRVLFHCMGLGFQGELRNQRDELDRRRQRLFEKAQLPNELGDSLTPEAYGKNSPRTTLKLPTAGILRFVVVALAAITFSLVTGNIVTELSDEDVTSRIEELQGRLRGESEDG